MKEDILPLIVNNRTKETTKKEESTRYKAIKSVCSKYHLKPRIFSLEEFKTSEVSDADPVIVLEHNTHKRVEYLCGQLGGRRTIFLGSDIENSNYNCSAVAMDQVEPITKIINYLISADRKKVALFAFSETSLYSTNYIDILLKNGEKADLRIKGEDIFWNKTSLSDCWKQLSRVIRKYNAVICPNDISAIYLCREAEKMGIVVPDDLFVIGNGNTAVGRATTPTITTISVSEEEIGKQGVMLYKYLKKHKEVKKATILVGGDLIARGSTGFHVPESKEKSGEVTFLKEGGYSSEVYDRIEALEKMMNSINELDLQIISGVREGVSYRKLAEKLYISHDTVIYRVSRILETAKAESMDELFRILDEWNITLQIS